MGSFGNIGKIIEDTIIEGAMYHLKEQNKARKEIIHLFIEGSKHYSESKRQMKISKELTTKGMMLAIKYNLVEEFAKMQTDAFIKILEDEVKKQNDR